MIKFLKQLFGSNKNELITEALKRGAIIIDVRSSGEFASGHIKVSKNIPLNQINSQIDKIKKSGKPVIVCCASGMRSSQAKSILASKGIETINGGSWYSVESILKSQH
jgi:phage shock protein E